MSKFSERKRKRRENRKLRMVAEKRKVCVLIPCDDQVATPFCMALQRMTQRTLIEQPPGLTELAVQMFGSSILPYSRQQLALYALEQGATHTLWIDSDMSFPEDMLLRFLARDEPIIGINAMSRRPPFRCTAQVTPDEPLKTVMESSGLEKVHRMGFGVMWVATSVFREMDVPYFDFDYVAEKHCWRGEDYSFFEKARALGHEFYVDHDLSKLVQHHGSFGYNPLLMSQMEKTQ